MNMMDIAEVAERFKADKYATEVTGIEIIEFRENYVKTRLAIEPKHMNALGIIQGGVLFTLADFTFAVAINAGQEDHTVAIECHISFLKPVSDGVLYAESRLISKSRSLTAQDVTITNERGEIVATFHGRGFVRQSPKR
jgi:acyl-CoA thioesterase